MLYQILVQGKIMGIHITEEMEESVCLMFMGLLKHGLGEDLQQRPFWNPSKETSKAGIILCKSCHSLCLRSTPGLST